MEQSGHTDAGAAARAGANAEYRRRLGVRIASLREGAGMSQRQFALVLELDRVTLNHVESGRGNPTLDTLARIADGLGITLDRLLVEAADAG